MRRINRQELVRLSKEIEFLRDVRSILDTKRSGLFFLLEKSKRTRARLSASISELSDKAAIRRNESKRFSLMESLHVLDSKTSFNIRISLGEEHLYGKTLRAFSCKAERVGDCIDNAPISFELYADHAASILCLDADLAREEIYNNFLVKEYSRTLGRINGIDSLFIPEAMRKKRFIEDALEEDEREEKTILKHMQVKE